MRETVAIEKAERARGSFFDMFRQTNLRRTEIELGSWMLQNWNGSSIYALAVVLCVMVFFPGQDVLKLLAAQLGKCWIVHDLGIRRESGLAIFLDHRRILVRSSVLPN